MRRTITKDERADDVLCIFIGTINQTEFKNSVKRGTDLAMEMVTSEKFRVNLRPLIVRSAGSASGKHIFDTFTAVSLVGHQEIRQLRVELFTLRTAQSAQEKDDFSTGARVHFARFPIVGGKVSAANRTTQMLRPRNNKNSFSHFLVKLDTMTTLQ